MKTKTKIGKQLGKKSNSEVVETILAAKKKEKWLRVAGILSGPRKKFASQNLEDIEKASKEKEIIVVPGKVLSQGEIKKKVKIAALGFSEKAKEKLEKEKITVSSILDEIKDNPEARGIRILTGK